jgi:hypothetical protein
LFARNAGSYSSSPSFLNHSATSIADTRPVMRMIAVSYAFAAMAILERHIILLPAQIGEVKQ